MDSAHAELRARAGSSSEYGAAPAAEDSSGDREAATCHIRAALLRARKGAQEWQPMVFGGEVQELWLSRLLSAVLDGSCSGEHSEQAGKEKGAAREECRGDGQARISR